MEQINTLPDMEMVEGEMNVVEDVVASVSERYTLQPDEAIQKTEELVRGVIDTYPEVADTPLVFLNDILKKENFDFTSTNFKGPERVQAEWYQNKQQEHKDKAIGTIEDSVMQRAISLANEQDPEPQVTPGLNPKEEILPDILPELSDALIAKGNEVISTVSNAIKDMLPDSSGDLTKAKEIYKRSMYDNEGNYGNASSFHKPSGAPASGSGWTLATGVDFKETPRADAIALGIPQRFIDAADAAGAWGKSIAQVPIPATTSITPLNKTEFDAIVDNLANKQEPFLKKMKKDNPKLSATALGILSEINHWAGSVHTNSTQKISRYRGNIENGTDSQSGEKINPISLLLKTGKATNQGLKEVLELIKKTYKPWEDQRPPNEDGSDNHSARYNRIVKMIDALD